MEVMTVATIVCLVLGVLLLIVEMFTPGLGLAGAIGLLALFAGVMLQLGNTAGMLFFAALVLFIIAVGLLIFFRLAAKGKLDKSKIILHEQIEGESSTLSESGMQRHVGRQGKALTPLRPAGKASFGQGEVMDVVTGGEFLAQGADVEIIAVEGMRIMVRTAVEEMKENGQQTTQPVANAPLAQEGADETL